MVVERMRRGTASGLNLTNSSAFAVSTKRSRRNHGHRGRKVMECEQGGKRPAAAGLFFDFGDGRSTAPCLLCYSACPTGKYDGKVNGGG